MPCTNESARQSLLKPSKLVGPACKTTRITINNVLYDRVTWKLNDAELDLNRPGFSAGENGLVIEPTTVFHEGFINASPRISTVPPCPLCPTYSVHYSVKATSTKVRSTPSRANHSSSMSFYRCAFSWWIGKEVDDTPWSVMLGQRLQILTTQNGKHEQV